MRRSARCFSRHPLYPRRFSTKPSESSSCITHSQFVSCCTDVRTPAKHLAGGNSRPALSQQFLPATSVPAQSTSTLAEDAALSDIAGDSRSCTNSRGNAGPYSAIPSASRSAQPDMPPANRLPAGPRRRRSAFSPLRGHEQRRRHGVLRACRNVAAIVCHQLGEGRRRYFPAMVA